jgi:AcrR family transcriptional regulator
MNQTRDKRQIILDIASRIFSHYGYGKTSLDDIATEAGVAKGTIYYYFPSKEDLFMAIVELKAEAFVRELHETIRATKTFEAKLRTLVLLPVRHMCEKMPMLIEGIKNIPFSSRDRFLEFRQKHRAITITELQEIIDLGKSEGKIAEEMSTPNLARVICEWFLMGSDSIEVHDFGRLLVQVEEDYEIIINMILYGIVKRG